MEKWLYYLKNIQNMDEQDLKSEQDPTFRQLLEQCTYSRLNNMEQDAYKKDFLEYEGVKDAIDYAREEGEARGLAEGEEKGLERGLAEGEEKEKRHTVLKMLSLGIDISTIVAVTGLSEDDIERMRSEG